MNKLKNVLLVYPQVPDNTYWSFKYALKFINKKSAMPPLGLITIAAFFPEKYNLKLVDLNIQPLKEKDILWADAVFVSAMIVQKKSMETVILKCNQLKTIVVVGGPHATSSHEEISGADHIITGEVEDTFNDFLIDLENGRAKKLYSMPLKPDLSCSVVPRFDLLNLKAYSSMSIQNCRGCPFKCEFCDIWKVYGNKPRLKNPENILLELDTLYELGWRGPVFIVDDNFIGNKNSVKKGLLPALKKWQEEHDYAYRFFTEASINMVNDEELLEGMRDACFNEVFVGIETPSRKALKETGKFHNLKTDMTKAVRKIQQYGMEVMAGFILGFDNDTEDIFDRQISFIQETGIPKAMVGMLCALPGTNLYYRLEKEGRIQGESMGNNTHCMSTNFMTIMDKKKLIDGYKKVLSTIYDSNLKNYFARCSKLMDNLGSTDYFQRKIHFSEILTLFRSISRQTFTPYGYQYLKFIIRNLIRHRNFFGETIRFGVIGHHFYIITQEMLKTEKIASSLDESYTYLYEQINQYSERVADNSREVLRNIVDLWNQKKEMLKKTKGKIDKLHVDFREEITVKYMDMSQKMKNLFKTFEDDLIKNGMTI